MVDPVYVALASPKLLQNIFVGFIHYTQKSCWPVRNMETMSFYMANVDRYVHATSNLQRLSPCWQQGNLKELWTSWAEVSTSLEMLKTNIKRLTD